MLVFFIVAWVIAAIIVHEQKLRKQKKQNLLNGVSNSKDNYYIKFHEAKMKNDRYYDEYLNWCARNSEIPMSKQVFIREVERNEGKIKDLLK